MKIKRWSCPYCAQTSTRHWNLKVHIHRRHNGIGEPIRTAAVSFNSSYGAVRGQLEPAAIHSAKRDNSFRNIPARVYKTDYYPNSMSSTTENNRTSSQNLDDMTRIVSELNDLLRLLPQRSRSSQNSDMMNNLALLLLLAAASSNLRKVQNNNVVR